MELIPKEIDIGVLPLKWAITCGKYSSRGHIDRFWPGKLRAGFFAIGCILAIIPGAEAFQSDGRVQRPVGKISESLPNAPVMRIAQSDDAVFRVNQLEDQVRRLNGQIEELNFQMLQMQERMRKMQEDNEYRFQELEDRKQGNLGKNNTKRLAKNQKGENSTLGKSEPSELSVVNRNSDGKPEKERKPRMIDGVEIYNGKSSDKTGGEREVPLGTITFDALGNVVDSALGKPLDLTARLPNSKSKDENNSGEDIQSIISSVDSARELYELGYNYFQAGDYSVSERVFSAFVERYPDDAKIPNAQFWLGESMFLQTKFEGAAKVFLDAHTNWPNAKIAPQTLLKLGISLAGMEQRELACATYAKVFKKYPNMSKPLRKRVGEEQHSAKCLNG